MNSFIHQNHILPAEQFGFHKQHSTLSQSARITNLITQGFNLRKHTGLVLLDIEKACDTLWLNGLLLKLISLHLPDYLLFFLKSYLEGCTFTVHLNDSTSTTKPTPSSLPQGAVLLTTLFSLYLSDIARPHTPRLIRKQQFPSILALVSWYYIQQTQSRCSNLTHFTMWKLQINNHKTATILFSKCNPPPPGPSSDPWHLCALGLNSKMFRPCARIKTALHQVLACCRQQSHRQSL